MHNFTKLITALNAIKKIVLQPYNTLKMVSSLRKATHPEGKTTTTIGLLFWSDSEMAQSSFVILRPRSWVSTALESRDQFLKVLILVLRPRPR